MAIRLRNVVFLSGLGGGGGSPVVPVNPLANDWADRVVANGGAMPSVNSIGAVSTFFDTLQSTGLINKMITLNVFAPDSLTACLTPVIAYPGFDIWTNNGFVAGDLSLVGLRGDGTSKYLIAGPPENTITGSNNYGFSALMPECAEDGGQTPVLIGTWVTRRHVLQPFQCPQGYPVGQATSFTAIAEPIQITGWPKNVINRHAGFYSMSLSSGTLTSYHNDEAGFSTVATGNGSPIGSNVDWPLTVFGARFGISTANQWLKGRLSFAAIHQALNATQTQQLANAVQTLRKQFNGGYYFLEADDAVQVWAERVVNNGGAAPSAATKSALQTFVSGLYSAGLCCKLKSVVCMVPDNLTAALTPIIVLSAKDKWYNNGHVDGNLTVNGLKGATAASVPPWMPYFDWGQAGANRSVGLHMYVSEGASNSGTDWGMWVGTQFEFRLGSGTSNLIVGAYNRNYAATNGFTGFVSVNLTATSYELFAGNGIGGFVTLGSDLAATVPSFADQWNIFLGGDNYSGFDNTTVYNPTNRRYSFAAVGDRLTAAEAEALYNLVQALRITLGGGAIIAPAAPAATAATSATSTGFTANWGAVSGATKYFLDVATNHTFSSLVPGFSNLDVGNVTTYAVTGLTASTPYFYRVRAAGASGTQSANSNRINIGTATPAGTVVLYNTRDITGFNPTVRRNGSNWWTPWGATILAGETKTASDGTLVGFTITMITDNIGLCEPVAGIADGGVHFVV